MPKQFRWAIKQKLTSAIVEMQKAMDKVTEVGVLFEKDHPEHYEAFSAIVAGLSGLKDATQNMSDTI